MEFVAGQMSRSLLKRIKTSNHAAFIAFQPKISMTAMWTIPRQNRLTNEYSIAFTSIFYDICLPSEQRLLQFKRGVDGSIIELKAFNQALEIANVHTRANLEDMSQFSSALK